MKDFTQVVRLTHQVDDGVHAAATDFVTHAQKALERITSEHSKLRSRVEELTRENETLQAENRRLLAQVSNQHAQPNARAPATAPPPGMTMGGNQESAQGGLKFVRSIQLHQMPVHSVAMDSKSRVIASASWDGMVKLYDLQKDEEVRTFPSGTSEKMGGLYSVAFAKNSDPVLGCTSCDRCVYVWRTEGGVLHKKLHGHDDEVNGIDFHPKQQVMCTASDDSKVIIWDYDAGMVLRELTKHEKSVYGCKFLGQENEYYVSSCCFDKKVRIWDMRDKTIYRTLELHTDDIIGIDYSSGSQLLATGSDDGNIGIWDTRVWKILRAINTRDIPQLEHNEVKRVAFGPNGELLAAACSSGNVLVYDVSQNNAPKLLTTVGGHNDCVFDVAWGMDPSTQETILVSASHDHTMRYWRGKI